MSKQLILLIVLLIMNISLLLVFKYRESMDEVDRKYTVTMVDLHNHSNYFKQGIYYEYNFSKNYEEYSKPLHIDSIFNQLLSNKIPVKEAWYKGYASACCPPSSDFCMQALVPPVFIIRLSHNDNRVKDFGFVKIKSPDIGWCAYYVLHYTFHLR